MGPMIVRLINTHELTIHKFEFSNGPHIRLKNNSTLVYRFISTSSTKLKERK